MLTLLEFCQDFAFFWSGKINIRFSRLGLNFLIDKIYIRFARLGWTFLMGQDYCKVCAVFSWCIIQNHHNIDRTDNRTTAFLKWMDFSLSIWFWVLLTNQSENKPENRSENLFESPSEIQEKGKEKQYNHWIDNFRK